MKTYEETLEWLLDIPRLTGKNTLEHTRKFLARLGNPQNSFQVIHVAGSNGKGSVCAYIDSVLRAAGKRTGLFTSPHLVRLEERFAVNGKYCAPQEVVWAADQAAQAAAELEKEGLPHPSFFEFVFAMGMLIFARYQVEYAVLETGLGGRLDATNIVEHPLLTVITSISLEHTEILGDTLEKIAAEKAGILKNHVPVVYDTSCPEGEKVIAGRADELNCPKYPVDGQKIKILLNTGKKIDFSYDSGYDVMEAEIPFGAPYQVQNAAVALQALECLAEEAGISQEAIQRGMAKTEWKGRMQEVRPGVYLDGAHNNAGIEKFLEAVEQVTGDSAVLLFSMVQEKDYAHAARRLIGSGRWEEVIVTAVPGARGVPCRVLAEAFRKAAREQEGRSSMRLGKRAAKITEIEALADAFAYAQKVKKPGQALFCAGSLYLIGELERIAGGMQK